jgi:hypothetical protein
VINADDYYGRESYKTLYDFLTAEREKEEYGVVGYRLDNTLSEHGTVNRGVCQSDANGYLKNIEECKQIGRSESGVISFPDDDGTIRILSGDTPVSMNMWGFILLFYLLQRAVLIPKPWAELKSILYPYPHRSSHSIQ